MNDALKTTVEAMAAPLAESLGLSIWGIEILGAGHPVLRIYVEGENGCDIDDCAELSRLLGLSLDVEDVMSGAYSLEVSSPGLERIFFSPDQLKKYINETVNLMLYDPVENWPGRKRFQGKLINAEGDCISVQPEDSEADALPLTTNWKNIQRVRLVHDFNANKGVKHSVGKARS